MGLDDDRIVNASSVSATLRCPICTEVYADPVFSSGRPCQHVFCRDCIGEALDRRSSCPVCRAPMILDHIQPNPVIQSFLDELHVLCEAGCSWTGRQDAHIAHLENCPSRLLASTREQLSLTSAQLRAQLEQSDRMVTSLRRENEQQRARYNRLWREMAKLRDDAAQKDAHILELRTELDVMRSCIDCDAAARAADMQAKAAAEAFKEAELNAEQARKLAAVARQRALDAKKIQVFVKDTQGKTLVCQVQLHDTIEIVKQILYQKTSMPPDLFYLTYGGKYLEDSERFTSYGISKDSTICMSFRLLSRRQGAPEAGQETTTERRKRTREGNLSSAFSWLMT
eukprot:TRINITY_DN59546_c0_g1_i1.p1 TRINITY_DN59546_c0_g1~~TRINITY_DN59546_c0_g1_i1.p1  ORF type:complete len:341 (-),score=66.73 TRINITY_DN59546_c0_g1_i1:213-1235(-)